MESTIIASCMAQLSGAPGVQSIEPAIYNTVLLSCGGRARGVVLERCGPGPGTTGQRGAATTSSPELDNFAPDADGIPAVAGGPHTRR